MKNNVLIFLVVIVAAAIGFFAWQENHRPEIADLKLRLKAGESHEIKYTVSQVLTHIVYKQPEQSNIKAEMVVGLDVINADPNGTMDAELSYKTMKLFVDSPHISIDTTNIQPVDPNDFYQTAIVNIYSAMIGTRLKIKINPMGEISDNSAYDKIREKVAAIIKKRAAIEINEMNLKDEDAAAVQRLKEMMEKNIKESLSSLYNEIVAFIINDTKEMMRCIIMRFPENSILAGGKWYGKSWFNLGFPYPVDVNTTYKFKQCKDNCAYIESVSDLDMGNNLQLTEVNNRYKVLRRMSGALTSFHVVDKDSGLLRKSESILKFSGVEKREPDKATLPIRPDMTIPITLEGSMAIELIK